MASDHHPRQRAERQTIAGVSARRVLVLRALADVGKAIGCLDDLTRPAMRQVDVWNECAETLFEAPITRLRIVLLPGLVVFPAENHHVMVPVRLDAKKLVGVSRVPPQRVGHDTARHTPGDHVAGVQRQLRLKQRGTRHPAEAHQWVVGRDDDVLAGHRMSVSLYAARVVAEFVGFGMLVDAASECHQGLRHAAEIPTRMETGLIREANAWAAHERHRFEVLRIEAQLARQLGVGFEVLGDISRVRAERRVEVPVDPLEARVDAVLADDVVNRGDGGKPGVPHRLGMGASESFHQVAETGVRHHCHVRAGVSRVGRGTTTTLEHDDTFAGLREEVRGRETGDPGADDDHIGLGIVDEFGKFRKWTEVDRTVWCYLLRWPS